MEDHETLLSKKSKRLLEVVKKSIGPVWGHLLDKLWPSDRLHFFLYFNFCASLGHTIHLGYVVSEGGDYIGMWLTDWRAACAVDVALMLSFCYMTASSFCLLLFFQPNLELKVTELQQEFVRESVHIKKSLDEVGSVIQSLTRLIDALWKKFMVGIFDTYMNIMKDCEEGQPSEVTKVRDALVECIFQMHFANNGISDKQKENEIRRMLHDWLRKKSGEDKQLIEIMGKQYEDFCEKGAYWTKRFTDTGKEETVEVVLRGDLKKLLHRLQHNTQTKAVALFKASTKRAHMKRIWAYEEKQDQEFQECVNKEYNDETVTENEKKRMTDFTVRPLPQTFTADLYRMERMKVKLSFMLQNGAGHAETVAYQAAIKKAVSDMIEVATGKSATVCTAPAPMMMPAAAPAPRMMPAAQPQAFPMDNIAVDFSANSDAVKVYTALPSGDSNKTVKVDVTITVPSEENSMMITEVMRAVDKEKEFARRLRLTYEHTNRLCCSFGEAGTWTTNFHDVQIDGETGSYLGVRRSLIGIRWLSSTEVEGRFYNNNLHKWGQFHWTFDGPECDKFKGIWNWDGTPASPLAWEGHRKNYEVQLKFVIANVDVSYLDKTQMESELKAAVNSITSISKDTIAVKLEQLKSEKQVDLEPHPGYLGDGDNICVAEMTIGEAKQKALTTPGCVGFCFNHNGQELRSDKKIRIFFKCKWNYVAHHAWTSFKAAASSSANSDAAVTITVPNKGDADKKNHRQMTTVRHEVYEKKDAIGEAFVKILKIDVSGFSVEAFDESRYYLAKDEEGDSYEPLGKCAYSPPSCGALWTCAFRDNLAYKFVSWLWSCICIFCLGRVDDIQSNDTIETTDTGIADDHWEVSPTAQATNHRTQGDGQPSDHFGPTNKCSLGCREVAVYSPMHQRLLATLLLASVYLIVKSATLVRLIFEKPPSQCQDLGERWDKFLFYCWEIYVEETLKTVFCIIYSWSTWTVLRRIRQLDRTVKLSVMINQLKKKTENLQEFDDFLWNVQEYDEWIRQSTSNKKIEKHMEMVQEYHNLPEVHDGELQFTARRRDAKKNLRIKILAEFDEEAVRAAQADN